MEEQCFYHCPEVRPWQQSLQTFRSWDIAKGRKDKKIIILLWATTHTGSIESLSGAENGKCVCFWGEEAASQGSYGDKLDFCKHLSAYWNMWRFEQTGGKMGLVCYRRRCAVFPLNYRATAALVLAAEDTKKHFQGRRSTQFKQKYARASLYPCTSLYLCSLYRQKLRVHWAKAIPVNSPLFHEKSRPPLVLARLCRACRDEPRSPGPAASRSFAAESFTPDCFWPQPFWPLRCSVSFTDNQNEVN